jgi:DNA polymerase III subunit beta
MTTFTADAKATAEAIGRVAKATSKRGGVEILTGVKVEPDGDAVLVSATDMTLTIRERIPASRVAGDGMVVLQAAKVLKGLGTMSGDLTWKEEGEETVAIRNGSTTLRYGAGAIADFPVTKPSDENRTAEVAVDRAAFMEAFTKVAACASKDASRPVLGGVLIEPTDKGLVLVATDSYRLALETVEVEGAVELKPITVPAAALGTFLKLKGGPLLFFSQETEQHGGDGDVAVRLHVADGALSATLRYVQGQFPNWKQLMPPKFECTTRIAKADLVKALDRMVKLAVGHAPARMFVSGKGCSLSLYDGELRSNAVETDLDCSQVFGEWFGNPLGFSPEFVLQAAKAVEGDDVYLHALNPLRPFVLSGNEWTDCEVPERCTLVMPIRLSG